MLFIQRALNPAHINNIEINEELKKADVFLNPDQVSLAIGKGGQNIKLASMSPAIPIDVSAKSKANSPSTTFISTNSRTK